MRNDEIQTWLPQSNCLTECQRGQTSTALDEQRRCSLLLGPRCSYPWHGAEPVSLQLQGLGMHLQYPHWYPARLPLILCILLAVACTIRPAQAQNTDRDALMALYNATGGSSWTNNTNWGTQQPLGSWYGVEVTNGRVTEVSLTSNGLSGVIPSDLQYLTRLKYLDLYQNSLSGSIPEELGKLSDLRQLDISYNDLSGSIPMELGNLSGLNNLSFAFNDLSGSIPVELKNLTKLTQLSLPANGLTGSIPSELGNLPILKALDLRKNKLDGPIPSELGDLALLENLELSNNRLDGTIPPELGNLSNLMTLFLADNKLTGCVPESIQVLVDNGQLDLTTDLPDCAIPLAPAGLAATPGPSQVVLVWTDPSNATITGYEYRQSTDGATWGSWTGIAGSGAATTTHTVPGLTNGTEYHFQIRAENPSGVSAESNTASATPQAPDTMPDFGTNNANDRSGLWAHLSLP